MTEAASVRILDRTASSNSAGSAGSGGSTPPPTAPSSHLRRVAAVQPAHPGVLVEGGPPAAGDGGAGGDGAGAGVGLKGAAGLDAQPREALAQAVHEGAEGRAALGLVDAGEALDDAAVQACAPQIDDAQPPLVEPVVGPDRGPTATYGGYLVSSLGCQSCHGANLTGGTPGDFNPPPGPNLTTLPQLLTVDAFIALLRTGTYSDGQRLSTEMPWQGLAGLSDDDLRAIYAHLEQVGPQSASQSARP